MSLESIVNVVISSNARGVSRKSFGVPLIIGRHTAFAARTREYSSSSGLDQMITDGIPSTSPIYKEAASILSANPKVLKFVVGKLTGTFTQTGTLTIVPIEADIHAGDVFSVTIVNASGVSQTVSHTAVGGALTPTAIATALELLLEAVTGLTTSSTGGVITWEVDADNVVWQFSTDRTKIAFSDETVAPTDVTLATDMAAINLSNGSWYGLTSALPKSAAIITALAAIVETQEKIFIATTHDDDCLTSGSTTNIQYTLKAAAYFRTACIFSRDQASSAGARWMGGMFPYDPGSATWAYKELSGTVVDYLTEGEQNAIVTDHINTANNGNCYVPIADTPCTLNGKMAGGEWIDVVVGRDWLVSEIRASVFGLLAGSLKVPYTKGGRQQVLDAIEMPLKLGINREVLSPDEEDAPWVDAPLVSEQSAANRQARYFPDISFGGRLAGAIHAVSITGVLKV